MPSYTSVTYSEREDVVLTLMERGLPVHKIAAFHNVTKAKIKTIATKAKRKEAYATTLRKVGFIVVEKRVD